MFKNIYIEDRVKDSPITKSLLNRFAKDNTTYIDQIDKYWGRVKKPYLEKRDTVR